MSALPSCTFAPANDCTRDTRMHAENVILLTICVLLLGYLLYALLKPVKF